MERASLELMSGPAAVHSYWATTRQAAEILGVTPKRVRQLAERARIPAVWHNGRWLFRREQLTVGANAREARKLAGEWGHR